MIVFDRGKVAPKPMGYNPQLGFWTELVETFGEGATDVIGKVTSSGSRNVHIRSQEEAVRDMGSVLDQYDSVKGTVGYTTSFVDRTIQAIDTIAGNFENYARNVGTSRALAGARDVRNLANDVIRGLQRDRSQITSGTISIPGQIPGQISTFASSNFGMIALVGVGLLLFMRRR